MRLERLAVPAFGPFTDFVLDLPAGEADLHLVFGPNEAGKSSLLRAIGDLLYGIHARTPDNFLHDNSDLRISATLAGAGGRHLSIQRRKGNKNTLLDYDGAPLPDDALGGLLGVVDRDFFSTVFALDSQSLRDGADALLHGRGELGQALFSASLAGTPVHRILAALEADAAVLFDGRRTKGVTIRPLVADYKASLSASRDAMVRPEAWERALAALADARSARDCLDEALGRRVARRDWVQRCLDALPVIGALGEQERLRAELPPLPDLGPGFVEQTGQSLVERNSARTRLKELEGTIARLGTRVEESRPDPRVLARAAEIESLRQDLAVQREWRNERIALEAERARLAAELAAGMRELGLEGAPDAVESQRARAQDVLGLERAATVLDEAAAAERTSAEKAAERRRELRELERKLAALPASDPADLRNALARTDEAAQLARSLPQLESDLDRGSRDCAGRHGMLPGAPGDPAAAYALPVPASASLRRFADEAAHIASDLESAADAAQAADAHRRRLAEDLARLEHRGTLPTERDLDQARAHRDRTWSRVVAAWKDGAPDEPLDGLPLAEAYPRTVSAADEIADRLREDAESVARAETLREQMQAAAADETRAQQALTDAESARSHWQHRWQAAWAPCGLEPGTPEEMQEWRDHWLELRASFETWQGADADLQRARARIQDALALLRSLLPDQDGADLPALRAVAERRVREADQARGARTELGERRGRLSDELDALDRERPRLEEAQSVARADWEDRCRQLALPVDAATSTALALLERRKTLVERYDRWRHEGETLAQKDRAITDYEARVQGLADALGIAAGPLEVRESVLWEALKAARRRQTRHDQAQRDLTEEQERLPSVRAALERAEQQLAAQLDRAGAADEQALSELLDGLKRRHAIDAEIERRRQTLHLPARGEPLDAFIERVRGEDADALAAERDGLDQAIAAIQGERDQALQALHGASAEKAHLEQSGAEAAAHLQDAEGTAARIRRDAARYLRLQLAVDLLRGQIERFRRESQGPLLARAGELFRRATGGSFEGLGTAFAGDDTPVLVGLRGGTEVGVDGMSDGTRDQLYLALRIAAIERHLVHHEPMPVVLDDLLMTFDDRRSLAILPILRQLAGQTQVLLFTHHRHLIDLARDALGDSGFHLHALAS